MTEHKRGCGFRKISGLYLVGTGMMVGCDRLPFPLKVCPVCNQGIKFSRGHTFIDFRKMAGKHKNCTCNICPVCDPLDERYLLMWVGKKYYSPDAFIREAKKMGVSKRINSIPKGLELGKTWVLLAHIEAGTELVEDKNTLTGKKKIPSPGIFYAFRPERVEKIVTEKQFKNKREMKKLRDTGITPIPVPDIPQHRGRVQ
jgi:hypothetical protein